MSEQGRKYDSVLSAQYGGKHYKEKGIQPIEYAYANDLNFFQGNVVKYVTRYKDKKGVEDLKKAIHYLQMILEFEYKVLTNFSYSDEQSENIPQEELQSHVKQIPRKPIQCEYCDHGWLPWPYSAKKEGSPCHMCLSGELSEIVSDIRCVDNKAQVVRSAL